MRGLSWQFRDVVAAILGALLVLGICLLSAFPEWRQRYNWGFGPDWDCRNVRGGEPICIHQTSPRP